MNVHHNHRFHFNAIYSGIAGLIGLICVGAVIIITVYRIHMRRQTMRQMMLAAHHDASCRRHGRHTRNSQRTSWRQSTPYYQPPPADEGYIPVHRCQASTNVAVNINLQFSPTGVPEFTQLVSPPPYSETEMPPREGTPPPPYATLDRHAPATSSRHNRRTARPSDKQRESICMEELSNALERVLQESSQDGISEIGRQVPVQTPEQLDNARSSRETVAAELSIATTEGQCSPGEREFSQSGVSREPACQNLVREESVENERLLQHRSEGERAAEAPALPGSPLYSRADE